MRYPNSFATDPANPTLINSSIHRSRSTFAARHQSVNLNLINQTRAIDRKSRSPLLRLSVLSERSRDRSNQDLNYQETSLCENNLCVHSAQMFNTTLSFSGCTSPDLSIDKHIYLQSDSEPPSVMRIEVTNTDWLG